jgi:hypothetical protein
MIGNHPEIMSMALNYAFGSFGLILLIVGIAQSYVSIQFLLHSIRVTGRLVRWDKSSGNIGSDGDDIRGRTYRAVVSFKVPDGSEHRVNGRVWSRSTHKPSLPIGSPFPVRYDPHNPQEARLATLMDFWFLPVACVVFGVLLMAIGLFHR